MRQSQLLEKDLYDPGVFSTDSSGPGAGIESDEDGADDINIGGASSKLPEYQVGGSKRRKEKILSETTGQNTKLGPFQDHPHIPEGVCLEKAET